jgi:hypothetical protein
MADERMRELERAAAGGEVEARSRLLRERVRSGDLDAERLALAAHVGDPAAVLASDAEPERLELMGWVMALDRWGREACVRAVVAAARTVLATWGGRSSAVLLGAAEAWLRCPCAEHAALAEQAADDEAPALAAMLHQASGMDEELRVFHEARPAEDVEAERREAEEAVIAWEAALAATRAVAVDEAISATVEGCLAAARKGEAGVRAAIRASLVPWALGGSA